MNLINKIFFIIGVISLLIACNDDEYGPRKESIPVIESATINPTTFTFGDSILLTAKINDPSTNLSMVTYEIVSENRIITSGEIPIKGQSQEVSHEIYVPLLSKQADNAEVLVNLITRNVLKGYTSHQITGLIGNRPVYQQLYLVTDDGTVIILRPQSGDMNSYRAGELTMETSFRFRIAEKIHDDNTIDYSGDVYGNVNGRIGLIKENGEPAFVFASSADYIKEIIFDNFGFEISISGSELSDTDLILSNFTYEEIGGESFHIHKRMLENGKSYSLFNELSDPQNIYNPDFFERMAEDKITFLGKTGEYTIYYNPVRKNIFVGVDNPSYPDYLLACGWGLGYPTNITSEQIASVYHGKGRTHTDWGFEHILKYVLLRQIDEGIYQGTFYTPADHDHYASFKPYENTGWGNEKQASEFTFTGEQIISGTNNWDIPNGDNNPIVESANYRFTINLNNNTVHIEKISL